MKPYDSSPRSSQGVLALQVLVVIWGVSLAALALLLLAVSVTWIGRLFSVTAILSAVLPALFVFFWKEGSVLARRTLYSFGGVWLIGAVAVVGLAPLGSSIGSTRVRQVYVNDDMRFHRFGLRNLLPEIDQLMLAMTLMQMIDPLFTTDKASKLKVATKSIYAELDADIEFLALGSSSTPEGHIYVYGPSGLDQTKSSSVIVFFHGSGGNFKAYLWLLSKVADSTGSILVAPSFGIGNWNREASIAAFENALMAASRMGQIDRQSVHLVGLSNGGVALSQLVLDKSEAFKTSIFISPVFDREISHAERATFRTNRPVLILAGDRDERVPYDYVEKNVRSLQKLGASTQLIPFVGEDHFLLFEKQKEVSAILREWLVANR